MGYAPAGQNLSVDSCYPDQKSSMKKITFITVLTKPVQTCSLPLTAMQQLQKVHGREQ